MADETEAAVQAVLAGGIARVVYRNAIAAVPDDLAFRRKFLTSLAPFRFLGKHRDADHIRIWRQLTHLSQLPGRQHEMRLVLPTNLPWLSAARECMHVP